MLNYYQPWLLPFLQRQPASVPKTLTMLYYHSFEDGLWDLINHKFPPGKKLHLLVPDFYCSDVLDNLILRGHKYTYYPLDSDFQISVSKFKKFLWLFRPDIVIIFHACGLTSNLVIDTSWVKDLPNNAVIIEDSVHRLVDPGSVRLFHPRQVVIDSLRKVSPFPGSRLFASSDFINYPAPSNHLSLYQIRSFFYYFIFRLVLKISFLINSSSLAVFAHEKLLRIHDEIIGDSFVPRAGLSVFLPFINRINYKKIAGLKSSQIQYYQSRLSPLYKNPLFFKVSVPKNDYPQMHVFPLGLTSLHPETIVSRLHSLRIPVWAKFTDTPWSSSRSVLFLPLGFHVSPKEIQRLSSHLASCS